ncbi:hypothetical protein UY3_16415 [Chelonia mydas]|uniref:Uncharacterized protein n=1 Tax=Chelonia mydas TaxID=8469 RepID=M7BE51_CHEMY|nr:hypothetical protein UY3_16415 [Chelonia mydas]
MEEEPERDTQKCRTKIKELRQVSQKTREVNRHSGAVPKTCHFYKELHAMLGSIPTSTAKSPVDTLGGLETTASGINPEDELVDKEAELEKDVGQATGSSSSVALACLK